MCGIRFYPAVCRVMPYGVHDTKIIGLRLARARYTSPMGMDRIEPERLKGAKNLLSDFLKDETSSGNPPSPEEMTNGLRMMLAAGALYTAAPSNAVAAEMHPRPATERPLAKETFSRADFEILAKNIFYEAQGESPEGQLAVAQVTFARLLTKRWGSSIHSVTYAKNQFSWTRNEPKKPSAPEVTGLKRLADVLASHFKGKSAEEIVRELSKITGLPASTLYYKRADWDENNPDETRMTEQTKAVFRALVWVKNIDKHAFYIDAVKTASAAQKR